MAKPMDAVTSFQHLVDNIPQWRESIKELSSYASVKHAEFVAEYSRLLSRAKPKKVKSASISSIRSTDTQTEQPAETSADDPPSAGPADFIEISPLEAGNRYLYAQAQRKRKPGTSMRSGASGPTKYRNKHMTVIYYDSYIQAELDKLVKGFGAARNNLRKGKNSYIAAKGFQLPSLSRRYDRLTPTSGIDNLVPNKLARPNAQLLASKSDTTIEVSVAPPTGEAAFVRTDKDLETIQTMCETAAHQAIRDGDCKLELENAARNLDSILSLVQTTLENLKVEAEERRKREEEEDAQADKLSFSDGTNASSQSTLCEKPSMEVFTITSKCLPSLSEALEGMKQPPVQSFAFSPTVPPLSGAIEVDDEDDQSSIDIDITQFRMRSAARRARA